MEDITNQITSNNQNEIDFNKIFNIQQDNLNNSKEYEESSESYAKEDAERNVTNPNVKDNLENDLKVENINYNAEIEKIIKENHLDKFEKSNKSFPESNRHRWSSQSGRRYRNRKS